MEHSTLAEPYKPRRRTPEWVKIVIAFADEFLILVIVAFLLFKAYGQITGGQAEVPAPQLPNCTSPMILVGSGCCLDEDANGVCDADDKLWPTSSTSTSSTSTSTSSSTSLLAVACRTNDDCGNSTSFFTCYVGDVYFVTNRPRCRNAATAEAECIVRIEGFVNAVGVKTPYRTCPRNKECVEGYSECQNA